MTFRSQRELDAMAQRLAVKMEPLARQELAAANDNQPETPATPDRFDLTWFDDIEEFRPKETIIRGVLGVNEFTVVVGKPGSGKSVILTDAACHVAAGKDWHGRRVTQGLVVYFAAERKELTERRMLAFRRHHGVRGLPLLVMGGRVNMTRGLQDAKDIICAIKWAEEKADMPCVWVIIDTLSRTFGAGDQNNNKDMGAYIQAVDEIRQKTRAHLTAIHHTPWNEERGKGAIDLDGAVDASFIISKKGKTFTLACDGANDGGDGHILSCSFESVVVGETEGEEPTTAPVVVPLSGQMSGQAERGAPSDGFSGLTSGRRKHETVAFDALLTAIADQGVQPQGDHFPDAVSAVTEEAWRAAYFDAGEDGAKEETLRKRFARAKTALMDAGTIQKVGQWVWVADSAPDICPDMSGQR